MKQLILVSLLIASFGRSAFAGWSQWTTGSGGNGHFYQPVLAPGGIDWATAEANAEAMGGYLATITSANENNFAFSLISNNSQFWVNFGTDTRGPWLGAYQPPGSPEPAGGWTWVTGEAFSYQNWAAGEPNNSTAADPNGEAYLQYLGKGNNDPANTWNDMSFNGGVYSYIVEANAVPEPSSIMICGLSAVLFAVWRRRNWLK